METRTRGPYREIFRVHLKARMAYRFDILTGGTAALARILFACVLWGAVFRGRETVGGFTLDAMLSYYVISACFSGLDQSGRVSLDICNHVLRGTFSKYMVIPVDVQGYFLLRTAGSAVPGGLFSAAAAALCLPLMGISPVLTGDPRLIVAALLMGTLGAILMAQLHFLIGILSFKYLSVQTFRMVAENITEFVTGAMIPLVLLPDTVVSVMAAFPFYYVSYLPALLLMGKNSSQAPGGLIVIGLWVLALAGINRLTYRHMRLRYEGVGI